MDLSVRVVRGGLLSVMFSVVLYCFVFKQKTAYEMRISDWSSDVCSSDLGEDYSDRLTAERVRRVINGYAFTGTQREELLREPITFSKLRNANVRLAENGRASCRERVRQYV